MSRNRQQLTQLLELRFQQFATVRNMSSREAAVRNVSCDWLSELEMRDHGMTRVGLRTSAPAPVFRYRSHRAQFFGK